MECVLEGNGVKAFGKAIYALSRVGDELWLDPTVRGLALRTVNSAQSAYACFLFSPLFFQYYSLGSDQSSETIKCKLLIKSLLPLFRCTTSIDRNVERCQISISVPSCRVIIQFYCRHGITKTHNLHYQESMALQAVFAAHLCPSLMKAPARLFSTMVMHFPSSQEEITLSVTRLRVNLRNYHEGGNDHTKMMSTEMSLHPSEFEYFQFGGDSDLTFCLKELRGLLSFAELHCLPVSVHFSEAGKPVAFSLEDLALEATVVLATLLAPESRAPSQPAENPVPMSPRCADAAAVNISVLEADGVQSQNVHVASSQRSLMINVATSMSPLPRIGEPVAPDETRVGIPTTPAPSPTCSLLFRALSSEGCCARLPVLACYSDTEDTGDSFTGCP